MNGQAQAVMLLLLGGAVLRATFADMHLRYVKPQLGPYLIAAGVVLVAAGVMTLVYELRRDRAAARRAVGEDAAAEPTAAAGRAAEPAEPAAGHSHGDHAGHGVRVGWLLLLPVLALLMITPPALGSYAAGQAGTVLSGERAADFAPLPAGEPVRLTVLDYAARAIFERGVSLRGRSVELVGFITPGPDGSPYLARIILSCCAADGRPIKVGLTGNTPAGRPADTWLRITGTYTTRTGTDPVNGEAIPYLEVETWEQIEPPKQQYE